MKYIAVLFSSFALMCNAFSITIHSTSIIKPTGSAYYLSAQLPLNGSGSLVSGNIQAQTSQVISNISSVLATKSITLQQVVKVTIYLADIRNYDAMVATYNQSFNFSTNPCVEVIEVANLPDGAAVQMTCVAYH